METFDPLALARETLKEVWSGGRRKYYRFRSAKFYGGIATADCVGCCLRCAFCWSWNVVTGPARAGAFHDAADVAARLSRIAKKHHHRQLRISGNEPTLAWDHLMNVLGHLGGERTFILETNGIILGEDEARAKDLSRFRPHVVARVSLKGCSEREFSMLTGAREEGFVLQMRALEHLARHGVEAQPAAMVSFSTPDAVEELRRRLRAIHAPYADLEIEEVTLYPGIEERLRKRGLAWNAGHGPDAIPPGQV